jgi:hypothetical protein
MRSIGEGQLKITDFECSRSADAVAPAALAAVYSSRWIDRAPGQQ